MSAWSEASYTISEVKKLFNENQLSGIPPHTMEKNVRLFPDNDYCALRFTFPDDIVTEDGQVLSHCQRVIVVKSMNHIPTSVDDGDIVYDQTEGSRSGALEFEDVHNGDTVYLKFYPISSNGVIGYNKENDFSMDIHPAKMGFVIDQDNLYYDKRVTYINDNIGFEPLNINGKALGSSDNATLGDWKYWKWFKKIKPYMVKKDGTADYALDPNDYTKKLDGTPSDVGNPNYEGAGAFVWFPVLYRNATVINGWKLQYEFSEDPDAFSNIEPCGFLNSQKQRTNGFWWPMFYPTAPNYQPLAGENTTSPSDFFKPNITFEANRQQCLSLFTNPENKAIVGGTAWDFVQSICTLVGKLTESQSEFGYGDVSWKDNNITSVKNPILPNLSEDLQGFYTEKYRDYGKTKAFHSLVGFWGAYSSSDPYVITAQEGGNTDRDVYVIGYPENKPITDITNFTYVGSFNTEMYAFASRFTLSSYKIEGSDKRVINWAPLGDPITQKGMAASGYCDPVYFFVTGESGRSYTSILPIGTGSSDFGIYARGYGKQKDTSNISARIIFMPMGYPPVGYTPAEVKE